MRVHSSWLMWDFFVYSFSSTRYSRPILGSFCFLPVPFLESAISSRSLLFLFSGKQLHQYPGVISRFAQCYRGGKLHSLSRQSWRNVFIYLSLSRASLVAKMVKDLPAMQETRFDPWVRKTPWSREWLPTPVFCWKSQFHTNTSKCSIIPQSS